MVRAPHQSSEGCGFDPCLGLMNHFSEDRAWWTFINHFMKYVALIHEKWWDLNVTHQLENVKDQLCTWHSVIHSYKRYLQGWINPLSCRNPSLLYKIICHYQEQTLQYTQAPNMVDWGNWLMQMKQTNQQLANYYILVSKTIDILWTGNALVLAKEYQ